MIESTDTMMYFVWACLVGAMFLAFYRLVRGPHVNDRIAALDLIASLVMAFILVYSVVINKAIYFDIAVVISLISFMGTIGVSTYLKLKK